MTSQGKSFAVDDIEGAHTQEHMSKSERNWSLILVSWCVPDLLLSLVVAFIAFVHAARDNGVSLYCLGVQAMAHWLSSVLLTRRFYTEYKIAAEKLGADNVGMSLLSDERLASVKREKRVSVLYAAVMILSSLALATKAIRKFYYWSTWYVDHADLDKDVLFATRFLAGYGFLMYAFQASWRGFLWSRLRHGILWQGFMCSLVSLLFMLALGMAGGYEKEFTWKVEPVVAVTLSLLTIGHAAYIIWRHWGDVEQRLQANPLA